MFSHDKSAFVAALLQIYGVLKHDGYLSQTQHKEFDIPLTSSNITVKSKSNNAYLTIS